MKETERFFQLETLLEPVFIASDYMADDGRPLAELTAVTHLKQGVEFEMRKCPYAGSRFDKDMNVSALPGLSQQIKYVISDTINLRSLYLTYRMQPEFTLLSFWSFTRVLDSMPAYLVRRRVNPVEKNRVPARVSAMFKAAQGLHLAPEVMLLDGGDLNAEISTDALIDFIEKQDLFMDDGRACAGPPAMIKAFVSSATEGAGKSDDFKDLTSILGEHGVTELFQYSDAVTKVFAAKILFEADCRFTVSQIVDQLDDKQLRVSSDRALLRFGGLRRRSISAIQSVQKHFRSIASIPEQIGGSRKIQGLGRLEKMLQLRNPHLSVLVVKKAVVIFLDSIQHVNHWLAVFNEGQKNVVQTLGYNDEQLGFSVGDFMGLGYIPLEVLSDWLNIDVQIIEPGFFVKAGASRERFDWA